MSKIKVVRMAFATTVALSIIGASSASADWFVNGSKLTTNATLSPHALVDASPGLLVPALKLSIQCSGPFVHLQLTLLPGLLVHFQSTFLDCNTTAPATGCALSESNEPIGTHPGSGMASLAVGEEDRLTFSPGTKNTLGEIEFSEANTCAFNGLEPVKGSFIANLPTGQLELLAQSLTFLGSVENNSLEIGPGNKAFFEGGRELLTLTSDSKWSFK